MIEGFQGVENHDIPTLHVCNAGARGRVAGPLEPLERAVLLEDCVEVPYHEDFGSGATSRTAGEELSGAVHLRRKIQPLNLETQGFQLGSKDGSNFPDTLMVHGARVDVHDLLQESDGFVLVSVQVQGHLSLVVCEPLAGQG